MSEAKSPTAPSSGPSINTGVQVGGPAPALNTGVYVGGRVHNSTISVGQNNMTGSGGVHIGGSVSNSTIAVGDNVTVTNTNHSSSVSHGTSPRATPSDIVIDQQPIRADQSTARSPRAEHSPTQQHSAPEPERVTVRTPGGREISGARLDPPQPQPPTLGERIRGAVKDVFTSLVGSDPFQQPASPQHSASPSQPSTGRSAPHSPPAPTPATETYRPLSSLSAHALSGVQSAVGTMQGSLGQAPQGQQPAASQGITINGNGISASSSQGKAQNSGVIVMGDIKGGAIAIGNNSTAVSIGGGGPAIAVGDNATALSINSRGQASSSQSAGQGLPMASVQGMGGGTITGVDLSAYSSSTPARPPSTPPSPGNGAGPAKGGQSR